jgi:hypothetical protein
MRSQTEHTGVRVLLPAVAAAAALRFDSAPRRGAGLDRRAGAAVLVLYTRRMAPSTTWLEAGERGREYRRGDHICAAYETPEEQLAIAVHYITDGLRRNERCLYSAGSRDALDDFCRALTAAGADASAAVRGGRLILLTKDEAHLREGRFDAEAMLLMLSGIVEEALNDGHMGLRTCGDMSWLLDEAPGSEQVVEYEALLNQFFSSVRATGMCQYDLTRLPEGLLTHALDKHGTVVVAGRHRSNPYYQARDEGTGAVTLGDKLEALRFAPEVEQ